MNTNGVHYNFVNVDQFPDKIEPNIVYVCDNDKAISLICPCGCGDLLKLAMRLNEDHHPSWVVKGNSMSPSINRQVGCRSHFTISNGITH